MNDKPTEKVQSFRFLGCKVTYWIKEDTDCNIT